MRFILLDQASANQLGEFATFEEAEAALLRFAGADPAAVPDLEIWDDDQDIRLDIDLRKIEATAA